MILSKPSRPELQRGHPLARGLIGAWLAHEGSGATTHDVSGYRKTGTFSSSSVGWSVGQYGHAYNFPNVIHNGINIGSLSLPIANGFSLISLIKADTIVGNANRNIFDSDDDANRVFQWRQESTNVLTLIRFVGGGAVSFSGTTNIKDGLWHLAVATFSTGSGSVIYLDGEVENSNANTGANDNGVSAVKIAAGRADDFHGDIATQLLYNRALTASEVHALHIDPFQAFRPRRVTLAALSAAATATVYLTWTDNADNESGFRIERSTDGVDFTQIGTAAADATSYDDMTALAGTTYHYRVRAYNDAGNSDYSNTAEVAT